MKRIGFPLWVKQALQAPSRSSEWWEHKVGSPKDQHRRRWAVFRIATLNVARNITEMQLGLRRRVLTVSLIALYVLLSLYPALRSTNPAPIDYNEGWNAYRQYWAASHHPLYDHYGISGHYDVLGITNYTPLSFALVGWLSHFATPTVVGRAVSFMSLFVTCLVAGAISARLSNSRQSGVYTYLVLWCWFAAYTPYRIGVNEPQLLATTFVLLGVFIYLRDQGTIFGALATASLLSIGILIKQNVIALPAALVFHIAIHRRWRELLVLVVIFFVLCTATLVALIPDELADFVSNILCMRALQPGLGAQRACGFLLVFSPAVASVLIQTCLRNGAPQQKGLLLNLTLTAHIVSFVFIFGDGVGSTIFFDPMIMLSIWCGVGISRALLDTERSWPKRSLSASLAILPLVPIIALTPSRLNSDLYEIGRYGDLRSSYLSGVAFLSGESGSVICENMQMCFDAGKDLFYDPFFVLDQSQLGRVIDDSVLRSLEKQAIAVVELEVLPGETAITIAPRWRFSEAFMRALLCNYKLKDMSPWFAIYVPAKAPSKGPGCQSASNVRVRSSSRAS
jgi:hypothetical protein